MEAVQKVLSKCAAVVLKGSPPEPCEEVKAMLKSYKFKAKHLLQAYDVFHALKQLEEVDEEFLVDVVEITSDSLKKVVVERRKWVLRILMQLLDMGDCADTVPWDNFLWVLIHFVSLTRVELAQAMFLLIAGDQSSTTVHYITAFHLQEFYKLYRDCPVKSFTTTGIDFDKLPLTRYYVEEYVELVHRFPNLLNPALYLQRVLQGLLPGTDFWDKHEREDAFQRRIPYDFFVMETGRVHLRGNPPFKESYDMLLPDALGPQATNPEQWIMRTSGGRQGKGLRQVSVWGEQPPPETIDKVNTKLRNEELARQEAEAEKLRLAMAAKIAAKERLLAAAMGETVDDDSDADAPAEPTRPPSPDSQALEEAGKASSEASSGGGSPSQAGASGPKQAWPERPHGDSSASAKWTVQPLVGAPERPSPRPGSRSSKLGADATGKTNAGAGGAGGANAAPVPKAGGGRKAGKAAAAAPMDSRMLSEFAATNDEGDLDPFHELPPKWMTACTIAPAPQQPNWYPQHVGYDKSKGWGGDAEDESPPPVLRCHLFGGNPLKEPREPPAVTN